MLGQDQPVYLPLIGAYMLCFSFPDQAVSQEYDPIRYSFAEDQLHIHGQFDSSIDQVTVPFVMSEDRANGELDVISARDVAGSIFTLRIGETFSAVFGEGTEIELDRFKPEHRPAELYYDYAELRGGCLRRSNGRMAIMIDLAKGGTVNAGNPSDTLFVFADDLDQIEYQVINRDNWTDADCLDDAREAQYQARQARSAERDLMDGLAPEQLGNLPADTLQTLNVKPLPSDPRTAIQAHFDRHAAYYFPEFCLLSTDQGPEECAKAESAVERVFKSETFDIHRVRFVRFCESAGADFLHDKANDTWVGLVQNLPGCSKYYLCQPDYHGIESATLKADLPDNCIHWGDWQSVEIDLTTFEVRRK
ncbi:MAG: hypothetical protein JXR13_12620 [Thalassovita sp.]